MTDKELLARITQLEKENARLKEVAAPFNRVVPFGMFGDEQDVTLTFKAKDFRALRRILTETSAGGSDD